MIAWDDLRLVKAIADTRSLAGAADALGVNHSTVFRRLGTLETTLGARLFERARSGYVPTTTGEEMVRLAERMGEEISAMERRITGQDLRPSGELRVTTNDTLLVHLLTPVFASFRRAYPEIRLEVIVSNQTLNLTKRDADVAIRASDRPGDTLVGRRLACLAWAVYGRPDALAGQPFARADIRHLDWVGLAEPIAGIRAGKWLRERAGADRIVYRVNTMLGLAEAAAAGMGLALLPCFIGAATPGLARLSEPVPEMESGLWLLTHPEIRQTARVRAFMEHAARELTRRRTTIEGKAADGDGQEADAGGDDEADAAEIAGNVSPVG
ncbi:LysR family transcriptional regulator [Azorhizobium oxalatiphilum]|uniref:LysR family transcriptional regulator n=1 Tax=Azorhizobium oxalatiphilum TaxID=980631 RepID=A0A917CJY2_9HYPH|nr:LysR family transcriptional regulator [Azorhizobium oxalatiphilum]GGF89037.1 LysR family transcriptional regulator [Azorhizobium oxalatiphilum]